MEKKKEIRSSKRGLTFSFKGLEKFKPGNHYKYIVDLTSKQIILLPAKRGLTISRKKSSAGTYKSLVDLRNKEVVDLIKEAERLEIEFFQEKIVVSTYKKAVKKAGAIAVFEKQILKIDHYLEKTGSFQMSRGLLKAVGETSFSYENPFSKREKYHQLSLEELFGSSMYDFEPRQPKQEIDDVIRVISLFSGAGMLDYPFYKDKKFKLVYAAEYDEDATKTYRHNIGDHIHQVDIRNVKATDLPDVDLIIGGPPCQPYSRANPSKEKRGENHAEGDMFKEYIRLVKETGVKMFLIENVPQLLTDSYGENMKYLMENLSSQYDITAKVIADCDVGGYTCRKRAFIIGSKIGKPVFPNLLMRPLRTAGEAIKKVTKAWKNYSDVSLPNENTRKKIALVPEGGNWRDLPEEMHTKSVHSNMYRRLDRNKPSVTICNWRKAVISPPRFDDSGYWDRILTVAEAAALSGMDSQFEFLGKLSSKQQQVGNGVPVALGNFVKGIVKQLFISFWNEQNACITV